jgi:mannosyltransferase
MAVSTTTARDPAVITPPRLRRSPGIRTIALGLGLFGTLISFVGSWIPSFWGDEAATVLSAERPLATLWAELGRVDAVHGAYYVFMHFWIRLFGASELSVRLPSAIAIGVAVAGVVVLANLLMDRRTAVVAGIVMAVLPRVTYMGAEGRSYAMTAAFAVWLSVLLVVLLRSGTTRRLPWIAYGVGVALSIYLFLYLILLAGVHLLVMLSTERNRMLLRRWLLAAATAVVLAGVILAYGLTQHHQIAFLGHRNYATLSAVLVAQWFDRWWLALPAWALVIAGAAVIVRRYRSSAVLLLGWLVLPTAALLVGNATIAPMYNLRYLSFCTPAVAIVMAAGVSVLARNRLRVAAVALIVGLAVPSYLAERTPYAKDHATNYAGHPGSDLRQAAQTLAANASPGDAVVFDASVRPSRDPRLALRLYPQDFTGLRDVELVTPYWQTSGLWDVTAPPTDTELDGTRTVWALELPHATTPVDILHLERLGYSVTKEIAVHRITVYELTEENQ